jgi:16S rRNA (cytosine1402-N4)-methyltransferase
VNAELEELEAALAAAETLLCAGGRLAVVSFHSLEDRIVKQFLRDASGANAGGSRHLPQVAAASAASFVSVGRAIRPSEAELARNPRSRSATLRTATRSAAPPRSHSSGERRAA